MSAPQHDETLRSTNVRRCKLLHHTLAIRIANLEATFSTKNQPQCIDIRTHPNRPVALEERLHAFMLTVEVCVCIALVKYATLKAGAAVQSRRETLHT